MASASRPAAAATLGRFRRRAAPRVGRGERGEFLFQFRRAALGAFRALPIARTNQNLAVRTALFAMKFVDRHGKMIVPEWGNLKPERVSGRPAAATRRSPGSHLPASRIETGSE